MSLRKKTFLIIASVLIVFIIARHIILRNNILLQYEEMEKKTLLMNLKRIKEALKEHVSNFSSLAIDYANWDDTYDFLKTRDRSFIISSFNPKSFIQIKLNIALITDTLGNLIFSREVDPKSGYIQQDNRIMDLLYSQNKYLFQMIKQRDGFKGLIRVADTLLIISSSGIRNSNFEGPDRGTLLFAKYFDAAEIKRLSGIVHLPVELGKYEDETAADIIKDSLSKEYGMYYRVLDDYLLEGYITINDIQGKPAFVLKSSMTREIYGEGIKFINNLFISNTILGIFILVLILFLVEKLILSRLMKVSNKVIEIGNERDFSSRISMTGKDELSSLVTSINKMLNELEQSQKDLWIEEEKYRLVINNIKEVIYKVDTRGIWVFLNPAWEDLAGYKPEECIGKPTVDFILPEDRQILFSAMNDLTSGKKNFVHFEIRGWHKDGTLKWIEVFSQPEFSAAGDLLGTSGIMTDVDARKKAEESVLLMIEDVEKQVIERTAELTKANEELQKEITGRILTEEKSFKQDALLDITPDAIMVGDYDNRIIYCNKGAEKIYGWKKEEVIGKCWFDFISNDERDELEYPLKIVEAEGSWLGELHQKNKNGKSIIIEARLTRIYDKNTNQKSILVVCSDITEKVKLEVQFMRAQRMESLGTLASGIAHDLNNVLAPLLMSIEILRTQLHGEGEQWISILDNSVRRGANLIKQILAFGRGVEGKHLPLQIRHLIKDYSRIIKDTFPKSINIILDIPNDLWLIMGDATQLQQLIMNLCVNAKDAMPGGGELMISASNFRVDENYARTHVDSKEGPYVLIKVSDTGTGIESKIIEKIFEPFFTTKELGKGTGLGLSTVFAIVKGHVGFINVYSEINKGTSFNVYFPAIISEDNRPDSENAESIPHGTNELILLVDDEFSIREITGATLEAYGYRVMKADNGMSAIEVFTKNILEIKLIIMDMVMPDMDGYTAISRIREMNPSIKIIANSGLIDQKKRAEELSVNEFLLKPFSADVLLKAIKRILE